MTRSPTLPQRGRKLRIRAARPEDSEGLAHLWYETGAHLAELNSQAFKMPDRAGLAEWFREAAAKEAAKLDEATFVAEVAGEVAGAVSVRLVPATESAVYQLLRELAVARAEIEFVAVSSRFRRQGIGRRLMEHAEEWARGKGAQVFALDTYAASPLSVPFYERLGYARRSIRFVKPPQYGVIAQPPRYPPPEEGEN